MTENTKKCQNCCICSVYAVEVSASHQVTWPMVMVVVHRDIFCCPVHANSIFSYSEHSSNGGSNYDTIIYTLKPMDSLGT